MSGTQPEKARKLSPWDVLGPHDVRRFGEVILDEDEQRRWSQAIFLGGLGYMWRQADLVRAALYEKLELRDGDHVLVIGEVIEGCGFADDIRERIGQAGELTIVDIVDEARDAYAAEMRGSGGQLATWEWTYTADYPAERFDCVAVLQGVQHTDDWSRTGRELARVMKSGRQLVLGEISFGPRFIARAEADIHISYLLEKIFDRMPWHFTEFPYYPEEALHESLDPILDATGYFEWRGVELFWGRKP